jgi:hypothetical protein
MAYLKATLLWSLDKSTKRLLNASNEVSISLKALLELMVRRFVVFEKDVPKSTSPSAKERTVRSDAF